MISGDKMKNIRLIARLDVKGPNLVKGIQLEGLRRIGNPNAYAKKYYEQGIDEILYIDIVASLYNRNNLSRNCYTMYTGCVCSNHCRWWNQNY